MAIVNQVLQVVMRGFHCGARIVVSGQWGAGLLFQPRTGEVYRFCFPLFAFAICVKPLEV